MPADNSFVFGVRAEAAEVAGDFGLSVIPVVGIVSRRGGEGVGVIDACFLTPFGTASFGGGPAFDVGVVGAMVLRGATVIEALISGVDPFPSSLVPLLMVRRRFRRRS